MGQAPPTITPWNPTQEALLLRVPGRVRGAFSGRNPQKIVTYTRASPSRHRGHWARSFLVCLSTHYIALGEECWFPKAVPPNSAHGVAEIEDIHAPSSKGQKCKIKVPQCQLPLRCWDKVLSASSSFCGLPIVLSSPWLVAVWL